MTMLEFEFEIAVSRARQGASAAPALTLRRLAGAVLLVTVAAVTRMHLDRSVEARGAGDDGSCERRVKRC